MAFIEQHDAKISRYLGDKKIHLKIVKNKRIEFPKFDLPILFGVEVECEVTTPRVFSQTGTARDYRAKVANELAPTYERFAIAKHDGSLKNGFEIVTVPMSIDAHAERWKPFLDVAKVSGLSVRATCGMHVHVSREHLTPLHIGKILAFIYNKDHSEFIKLIADRAKPVYNGMARNYVEIENKKITDVNRHFERYSALNITGDQTIEFRLFKSSLDLNRILQNIEFCDALVRLTWPSSASIEELKNNGIKLFCNLVEENRKEYSHLADFLRDNGYITKKVKKIPVKYRSPKITPKPKVKKTKFGYVSLNQLPNAYF